MTTGTSVQDTRTEHVTPAPERYTVEQLAAQVGMSPRNIRAYQTRKLLDPPVRQGRAAYYTDDHRRRLERIQALQEQGFNLVAIEAILAGSMNAAPDGLAAVLDRVGADHPDLVYALSRLGVVSRAPDGGVRPIQSRVLQSTLNLDRAGLSAARSLQLLVEVLDSLAPLADRVGQTASARLDALARQPDQSSASSWERVDRDDTALRQGLADLLTEAFRMTVDRPRSYRAPRQPAESFPAAGLSVAGGVVAWRRSAPATIATSPRRPGTASFR
jgi:DNA-binding transcriptional MerR regulator